MGLATIVSLAPFPVSARLINREPAYIEIKPAIKGPQMLVMRDGISRFYVPEEFTPIDKKSHIYIPTLGASLAEEVVYSNVIGTPHVSLAPAAEGGCQPGIFWVDGGLIPISQADLQSSLVWHSTDQTIDTAMTKLKKDHPGMVEEYEARQNNWYDRLVKDADDKWQKYRMNVVISDIERHAARKLGIKREWLIKLEAANLVACPFCTTLISPLALICPNCREVLDKVRYEALKGTATQKSA